MKKSILTLLLASVATLPFNQLSAYEYVTDTGGNGYDDCCRSICIVPAIGFAAAIVAGIIAVGVHNRSHSGHSSHSHSE